MNAIRPLYADLLPADVRAHATATKASINWDAPFHPDDDLRITTPIAQVRLPKAVRRDLAAMPAEYRAKLEREWLDAEAEAPLCGARVSDEIRRRAAAEWDQPADVVGIDRSLIDG